jgi:hypothetical protein
MCYSDFLIDCAHGVDRRWVRATLLPLEFKSPDDINVKWHYILSLTRNSKHSRKIRILSDPGAEASHGKRVMIGKLVSTTLNFNELLVHAASHPYGIADAAASMDPLEGAIFLDGYLW